MNVSVAEIDVIRVFGRGAYLYPANSGASGAIRASSACTDATSKRLTIVSRVVFTVLFIAILLLYICSGSVKSLQTLEP
jgi:hypothetical protein